MQNLLLSIIVLLNYNFVINKNMEKDNTQQMLNEQIIARGVKDNSIIINAMSNVSRKDFISHELRQRAYEYSLLPIGYGQTISQPYISSIYDRSSVYYRNCRTSSRTS